LRFLDKDLVNRLESFVVRGALRDPESYEHGVYEEGKEQCPARLPDGELEQ
jgi:hypothetical protein